MTRRPPNLRQRKKIFRAIRALKAQGLRNDKVAEELNSKGILTTRGLKWNAFKVSSFSGTFEGIKRTDKKARAVSPNTERTLLENLLSAEYISLDAKVKLIRQSRV